MLTDDLKYKLYTVFHLKRQHEGKKNKSIAFVERNKQKSIEFLSVTEHKVRRHFVFCNRQKLNVFLNKISRIL